MVSEIKLRSDSKILVISASGIGDHLMFLPVLYNIKKKFPSIKIDFFSNKSSGSNEVAKLTDLIEDCILYEIPGRYYTIGGYIDYFIRQYIPLIIKIKKRKYDYVMSINKNILTKSILYIFKKKKRIVGANSKENQIKKSWDLIEKITNIGRVNKYDNLLSLKNEEKVMEKFGLKKKEYLLISPIGASKSRTWGSCNLFFNKLKWKGEKVLIGKSDAVCKNKNIINLLNKTTLEEVAIIVKNCKLFIAVDGGLMYLGVAQNVPIIGLFSSVNSKFREPVNINYPFWKAFNGRKGKATNESKSEIIKDRGYMDKINIDDVVRESDSFLK